MDCDCYYCKVKQRHEERYLTTRVELKCDAGQLFSLWNDDKPLDRSIESDLIHEIIKTAQYLLQIRSTYWETIQKWECEKKPKDLFTQKD